MNLTPKQLEIVKFIVDYRERRGLAPTLEEIARELGVSKITVYEHVAQLERKGAITKQKYQSRSIQVTQSLVQELADLSEREARRVAQEQPYVMPLMGTIAAGAPIEAIVDQQEFDFADLFQRDRPTYVLKVKGLSMIDEGIRSGDYVLVENRRWASNGETVVAIIGDNEATLKKYYKEGGRIRLQPANPELEPIVVDQCEIRGVVVGLVRRF